ncbi:hypothetical protein BT96DRAFT_294598 [Gymnopus androsaceus JB14]|uniref:Uncharacterized protein n=1 Tax=Gymnopus androsaceus JB14 TaxID=1447944 RepID=A0A6A4I811_9AGAR|nr:hypothetical protein BT96DRAFT_294598 [Gymnopus androsaceus JB14]
MTKGLPDLSQVPTSQSQEVDIDLSLYGKRQAPPSDEIVPSSQSPDLDTMCLAVSPRRVRVMRQLEQDRRIAAAAELREAETSKEIKDSPPLDEIVPCSQSQDVDSMYFTISPRRVRVMRQLEQDRRIAAAAEIVPSSQSQEQDLLGHPSQWHDAFPDNTNTTIRQASSNSDSEDHIDTTILNSCVKIKMLI